MLLSPADPAESDRCFVAAKSLRDSANVEANQEFLAELEVMKSLRHPHLVQLHGAVTATAPQLIVLEYLPGGALDEWLQVHGARLRPEQAPKILHQIALGMSALAAQDITHRDLAARNVLVGEHDNVKVADFGLSRMLDEKDYYTMRSNGMIALRWTAPECFATAQWTSLSDVYSLGVVVSEVYTWGCPPFESLEDSDMVALINSGTGAIDQHLAFSAGPGKRTAPPRARELAGWCLQRVPASRPSFEVLAAAFLELAEGGGGGPAAAAATPGPQPRRSNMGGYLDVGASDDANC
jgi:neurotrophic tyrosine kinase receptor type 2